MGSGFLPYWASWWVLGDVFTSRYTQCWGCPCERWFWGRRRRRWRYGVRPSWPCNPCWGPLFSKSILWLVFFFEGGGGGVEEAGGRPYHFCWVAFFSFLAEMGNFSSEEVRLFSFFFFKEMGVWSGLCLRVFMRRKEREEGVHIPNERTMNPSPDQGAESERGGIIRLGIPRRPRSEDSLNRRGPSLSFNKDSLKERNGWRCHEGRFLFNEHSSSVFVRPFVGPSHASAFLNIVLPFLAVSGRG